MLPTDKRLDGGISMLHGTDRLVRVLIALAFVLIAGAGTANADPSADLAAAQAAKPQAEAELQAAQVKLGDAQSELAPIASKANRAQAKADRTAGEAEAVEQDLIESRQSAAQQVADSERQYSDELAQHDSQSGGGIGFGIGLLLLAGAIYFWSRLRQSTPIRWLAGNSRGQAIAIGVGSSLVGLLLAGALLDAVPVIGGVLIALAIGLPVLALLARHSLRVEDERSTPLYLTGRASPKSLKVAMAIIGALALVSVIAGLGSALPEKPTISGGIAQLADEASGDPADPATPALVAARKRAKPLEAEAQKAAAKESKAQASLTAAQSDLSEVRKTLASIDDDIDSANQLIAQQQAQAERDAARAQAQAEREAARTQRAAEREAAKAEQASGGGGGSKDCTPGYSPCLPPASDYDCPGGSGDGPEYAPGTVQVSGSDPYGLDSDGDGTGCE